MEIESKRNISDKWIDNNVYEALEDIEKYERQIRNGCNDLLEYIQSLGMGIDIAPTIRLKAMRMMINEFEILVINTKSILQTDDYKDAKEKLKIFQQLISTKGICYDIEVTDSDKGKILIILNNKFDKLAEELYKLREKLIENYDHILYLKSQKFQQAVEY